MCVSSLSLWADIHSVSYTHWKKKGVRSSYTFSIYVIQTQSFHIPHSYVMNADQVSGRSRVYWGCGLWKKTLPFTLLKYIHKGGGGGPYLHHLSNLHLSLPLHSPDSPFSFNFCNGDYCSSEHITLTVCLCMSVYLSICLCMSICLSICLCMSICLFVYVCVCS